MFQFRLTGICESNITNALFWMQRSEIMNLVQKKKYFKIRNEFVENSIAGFLAEVKIAAFSPRPVEV